jgi:hypothetical protein
VIQADHVAIDRTNGLSNHEFASESILRRGNSGSHDSTSQFQPERVPLRSRRNQPDCGQQGPPAPTIPSESVPTRVNPADPEVKLPLRPQQSLPDRPLCRRLHRSSLDPIQD